MTSKIKEYASLMGIERRKWMTGKLPTNYSLNILMNFLLSEYANSLRLDELSPEKKASTPNPE